MGKLTSGRVKRTPQVGITSDRYQYLSLDQAEPNLGDPLVGPSSIGANPIPVGPYFSLLAIGNNPGKRYWGTPAGISSFLGVISVYNNGILPNNTFNQINALNFVGSGVTIETPAIPFAGEIGIATIRIGIVSDIINQGSIGQVLYNSPTGLVKGSPDIYYSSGNVGIGTVDLTSKLTVFGDINISNNGKLTSNSADLSYQTRFPNSASIFSLIPSGTSDQSRFLAYSNSDKSNSSYISVGIQTNTATPRAEITVAKSGTGQYTPLRFNIGGLTGVVVIDTDGDLGIGTLNPTSKLHVVGNALISGIVTASTFVGSLTGTATTAITALSVGGGSTGTIVAGIASLTQLFVSGITTLSTLNNTGLVTTKNLYVGSGATISGDLYVTTKLGINTTSAQYSLDVRGGIGVTDKIFLNNYSGADGEVLLSGGTGPARWGVPTNVTVGAANSVGVANTQLNTLFYPTFTAQTQNNAYINVNTSGLVYNPSTNRLGIGTTSLTATLNIGGPSAGLIVSGFTSIASTFQVNGNTFYVNPTTDSVGIGTTNPSSKLTVAGDIISNVSTANTISIGGGLNQTTTGILTTTNTTTQVLDSFSTSTIRSSKYKVQITTTGQLVGSATSSSTKSVSNLIGGSNYIPGSYTNIGLSVSSGSGNDARANIIIREQFNKSLLSIVNGRINFDTTSGITTNSPIIFNKSIPATDAENSKVTSVRVVNPGLGYTTVPTVTFGTPTNNPPILGVGVASTAVGFAETFIVSNVKINTPSIHNSIPTVLFKVPTGVGNSATGLVGFGVSSISITNSGFNYVTIPTPSINQSALTQASIGISSIVITNLRISNIGFGYTIGNYPTIQFTNQGSGTGLAATVSSLNISNSFQINPGAGYTTPPLLTASSPSVGVNTATLNCTLGISTFIVTNTGSGYTASPNISFAGITGFSEFNGYVGLGLTSSGITFYPGSGYGGVPTVTVNPVGGIGTGAQLSLTVSGNNLTGIVVVNPGFGYTVPPTIVFSGGNPSVSAAATVTTMAVANVTVNNTGFGATIRVPVVNILPVDGVTGAGAAVSASMGIGTVTVNNFGSGYNLPPSITVTSVGGVGSGASVIAGLGVTSSNITITNPGVGYTIIPSFNITSPVSVASSATGLVGIGVSVITVNTTGAGYTGSLPTILFSSPVTGGSGAAALVNQIITTNVVLTNPGVGYTSGDLNQNIITYNPVGTSSTVGFGISTIVITNPGLGYTTTASASVSISAPSMSDPGLGFTTVGMGATAVSTLGYPGILAGPGYAITNRIYYVADVSAGSIGISTGVGIGTLSATSVADKIFDSNTATNALIGGSISNVSIISPGSGYVSTSVLTATNFDGANVGIGFSFISGLVVNNYQFSDVMVLQNVGSETSNTDLMEYATLANEDILASYSSDISGSNARLLITPTYRNNTIKITKDYMSI